VIKSLLKLALAAFLANAAWRIGVAYVGYYRFTDGVQQLTHYRGAKTDAEIHDRVFTLASQNDIAVTDETLTIQREENRTIVKGAYTKPIEFLPGVAYDWPFTVHIDTPIVGATAIQLPGR
jgi:hypothetical protein